MDSRARIRLVLGLSGALLATLVACALLWKSTSFRALAAAGALVTAAALSLAGGWPRREAEETAAIAHVPARREPPVGDLLDQLRTLRETQRELLAAKRASEAAALAKDEFLATMSHEIRTPLNGVLPLLELTLSTPLSPEQHEYLETAHRSAQEMLRIVDDILDYSKLEVGKLELENIGINLRDIVDGVAQLMRRSADAKGLRLGVEIARNVRLAVRGDPVRLRQVLMNLISNAIKFTERGGVTVLVSRRAETATAYEIAFAVRDTGIGMSPEVRARLFQPFAQGDASITRAFGGTGLGLVICKRLVELMGGQIGVQSEPGRGSLFWFSLPLSKVAGDLAARHGARDLRALLVGDDTAPLRRVQSLLADLHVQTTAAATQVAAFDELRSTLGLAARWQYGLVVVDAESSARGIAFARNVLGDAAFDGVRLLLFVDAADVGADELPRERVTVLARSTTDARLRSLVTRLFEQATAETAPGPVLSADAADAEPAEGAAQLSGRVLLVEDNAVNQFVARRMLAACGLEVDTVDNGEAALAHLRAEHYDIVLMDCQMPVLDGYSATRRWREEERAGTAAPMPIVAMTANAMAGDREKCLAAGMDDYLPKPLERGRLEQTLARWLTAAPIRTQARDETEIAVEAAAPGQAQVTPQAPTHATSVPEPQATAATVRDVPALDEDILLELRDSMGDDFDLLVRLYLEDAPLKLAEIERHRPGAPAAATIVAAHTLKSSSANLGAMRLAELAREVEEGLRQSAQAPLHGAAESLRAEFARAERELRALLPPD